MTRKEYDALIKKIEEHCEEISTAVEKSTIDLHASSAIINLGILSFNGGMLLKQGMEVQIITKQGVMSKNIRDFVYEDKPDAVVDNIFNDLKLKSKGD